MTRVGLLMRQGDNMTQLQQFFDDYNHQFFRGRLPKYRVRFTHSIHSYGECSSQDHVILLSWKIPLEELRQYLLHEMCNIGCPDHGKRFTSKLQKLADQGEEWAVEEIRLYREGLTWNQEMTNVKQRLEEIALNPSRPTFSQVNKHFAENLGLSPTVMRKKVPWLRTAWEKACNEGRE